MAHKNTVLKSINEPGELRCIDIFMRPDDSYGFEAYRRDSEDNWGWFPDGGFGGRVFATPDEAMAEAKAKVPWLKDVLANG